MDPVLISISNLDDSKCAEQVEQVITEVFGNTGWSINPKEKTASFSDGTASQIRKTIAALHQAGFSTSTSTATLEVQSMSCASCVGVIERALLDVRGVVLANANLAASNVFVEYLHEAVDTAELIEEVGKVGYVAQLVNETDVGFRKATQSKEAEYFAKNALYAAILGVPVIIVEMGQHAVPSFQSFIQQVLGLNNLWLVQLVLTSWILAFPGRRFFSIGIAALFRRVPDTNSLVCIGTGAAWLYSSVVTIFPYLLPESSRQVYFEAAAAIIVFILIGRWLEAKAKDRVGSAIESLMDLQSKTAKVLRNGNLEEIDVEKLELNDTVVVRPGERIPTDGFVIEGSSLVDESMLTGESVLVEKTNGSEVTGGTINESGSISMSVQALGSETTLAQIVQVVEQAQNTKLPVQQLADKVTRWFIPVVLVISALTTIIWLSIDIGGSASQALVAGVSVLIIACPCAMGLATPVSVLVGTRRAAEMGVLFRNGDAIQQLTRADIIIFDKTGTVTEGQLGLSEVIPVLEHTKQELLALAAAVESRSEHPIAAAIYKEAKDKNVPIPVADSFESLSGLGAVAIVNNQRVLVGSYRFMIKENVDLDLVSDIDQRISDQGKSSIFVGLDGRIAGVIVLNDVIRPSSKNTIAYLHEMGLETMMMTGDRKKAALKIAEEVGIKSIFSEMSPIDKAESVRNLINENKRVVFVGDGINDSAALAQSDVGIAIGTGSDISIESAGVVLMSGDLRGVVNSIYIANRIIRNIRQNLIWAFGYNTALIPVAAGLFYPLIGVLLSPVFAAVAMALSSISVVLNALRLKNI